MLHMDIGVHEKADMFELVVSMSGLFPDSMLK